MLWEKCSRKNIHQNHPERPSNARIRKGGESTAVQLHVESREEAGHWEIDLITGGKDSSKAVILTLTERRTRVVIARKLKDKTQRSVIRAINGLERMMGVESFRIRFKTITADNGSEFLDAEALESSVLQSRQRTQMYYAHAYSSWKRGSNDSSLLSQRKRSGDVTRQRPRETIDWINNYPRKILNFKTAADRFSQEIAA